MTAGVAATAYAGIPVTHRDDASAVAFVTGHEDPEKEESALDWEALARFPGTLVLYMGVKRLAENAAALIDAGRDPDEPAAAVERGTMAGQRTVTATLATLAAEVEREGIGAPAVIVVGEVVGAAGASGLARAAPPARPQRRRHPRPRAGQRPGAHAAPARRRVVELPAIRFEPRIESDAVQRAVDEIEAYSLVCLTSPNGVRLLFESLAAAGRDARALAGATVAAIGPGTAAALAAHGIEADVVPERFVAEALLEALGRRRGRGRRVLSPAPPRPATSFPMASAIAAPRSTTSPSTRPSARSRRRRRSRRPRRPTTSPSPPPPRSAT